MTRAFEGWHGGFKSRRDGTLDMRYATSRAIANDSA